MHVDFPVSLFVDLILKVWSSGMDGSMKKSSAGWWIISVWQWLCRWQSPKLQPQPIPAPLATRMMNCSCLNHSSVCRLEEKHQGLVKHTQWHTANPISNTYAKLLTQLESGSRSNWNVRVSCCPGKPCEDGLVGGIEEQRGEGQRWRQPVFITKLCWSHPMKLLDLRKVHLGGDQNTWDVVFHVVLLRKKKDETWAEKENLPWF